MNDPRRRLVSATGAGLIVLWLAAPGFGQFDAPTLKLTERRRQQYLKMAKIDGAQFVDLDSDVVSDHSQEIAAARARLEKARKQFGEDHIETANALEQVGIVLSFQRDYAAARTHLDQALTLRKKVRGEAHPDVAVSYEAIAGMLMSQKDYAAAGDYFEQALQVRRKALGAQNPETIRALENLAAIREGQRNYAAAQALYNEAVEIKRKVYGDSHSATAASLMSLSYVLNAQFDYAGAAALAKQASQIYFKLQGPESLTAANSLRQAGFLLNSQGDYDGARRQFQQVLAIHQKVLGSEHYSTANAMQEFGVFLQMQGDYTAARSHFEQALSINRKILGDDYPETTGIRISLAGLLEALGDDDAARVHYEQSVEINRKVLGDDHPQVADPLARLGSLLELQGDHDRARSLVEQALEIRKRMLGDDHDDTADSYDALGHLLHSQGDYADARQRFRRALKIRKKRYGEEHLSAATSYENLGSVLDSQGQYDAARPYYEHALQIRRKVLGATHPDTAALLESLAVLNAATASWDEALQLTEESRRSMHGHVTRNLPSLSPPEQLTFIERTHADGLAISINLALAQVQNPEFRRRAAEWVLNGKGLGQEAMLARTLLSRDLTDPALTKDAARLAVVQQKLAAMTLASPDPGQEQARLQQIEAAQTELDELSRKLAAAGGTRPAEWVSLDQLRQFLARDEVFINLVRFDVYDLQPQTPTTESGWKPAHYAAWIVPADAAAEVALVDLGPAKPLDEAVAAVRTAIAAAGGKDSELATKGEAAVEAALRQELKRVADQVWQPLASLLGDARSLVISPDSDLWLLPWAALPVGDDKYLLEDYSLKLVVSGRELGRKPVDVKTTAPCLFANPNFNLTPAAVAAAINRMFPKRAATGTAALRAKNRSFAAPPLPGTATEVQAIAPSVKTLTREEPRAYTGEWALETVVKAVQRPKVLVLSTHGYFQSDQSAEKSTRPFASKTDATVLSNSGKALENPFLRCGLLFSGCNSPQSAGDDDGVLTGLEISGLDLRGTDLVVLSACETGIGQIRNGEGVAGLRQAFQLAGANSVVATLWQIPDVESARIMNLFFEARAQGTTNAESLRQAQLTRIKARREKFGAAHPYFWAAYTLTGP